MIKVSTDLIDKMEKIYPEIKGQIKWFENLNLPPCPVCAGTDVASVQVGIIGRTIHLALATTKFHLMLNYNGEGIYYCNTCRKFFGPSKRT